MTDRALDWERLRAWRALATKAVRQDRWDEDDWAKIHSNMTSVRAATNDLTGTLPTGKDLMSDVFTLLHRVAPEMRGREEMRPEAWLNHAVADETRGLGEYTTLHRFTRGDPVASALACVQLEPDIETLVDRQQRRQEATQRLQDRLDALSRAMQARIDVDEMAERWLADHGELDEDLSSQADEAAKVIEDLEQAVEDLLRALEEDDADTVALVREALARALPQATAALKAEAQLATAVFGTAVGQLRRLPVEERLALARRLNNDRLRLIAQRFGAMRNLALGVRQRVNPTMRDEVVGVALGRDMTKVLPSEFAKLRDPVRRYEFYRDFAEGRLSELDFTGMERQNRGAIILCEDGSGSMAGEREIAAKALMLNLLDIARQEGRAFHLIHFGGPGQYHPVDFPSPDAFTPDRIFEAIEIFFDSGTDFETPLNVAVERLQAEYDSTGRVDGDIVFVTDGLCRVTPQWQAWFHETGDRLGYKVWGVNVAMSAKSQPLYDICRGRTASWNDMCGPGREIADVFGGV